MVNVELNVLLHKTVKNLHSLNTTTSTTCRTYETVLKETIIDLLKLLDYYGKSYKSLQLAVDPSIGDIGSINLLCYSTETKTNIRSDLNLLQYLQTYNENNYSTKSILKQIIQLLTKLHDKKPKRVKDSFTFILVKFSKLLNVFLDLQNVSEQRFIDYLYKCYQHEIRYYSKIQERLESTSGFDEKDTQKIVELLDNMILGDSGSVSGEDDSIFSYDTDFTNIQKSSALNFRSNDKNFDELYFFFLHILRSKPIGTDYLKYIKIMLNIYSKHNKICSIEINDFKYKELKINSFYNFFVKNEDNNDAMLPAKYKEINDKILSEYVIFPEMKPLTTPHTEKSIISESTFIEQEPKRELSYYSNNEKSTINNEERMINHEESTVNNEESMINYYDKEDQNKIVNNLKHIIPLLNEFNLNFDLNFPAIFKIYLNYVYNNLDFDCGFSDYDYINKIMVILNHLVDFENNELTSEDISIREKVDQFYELHLNLTERNQLVNNSTLLMRLSVQEHKNSSEIKRDYFKEWNIKTLEVSQLEYNLENYWIEENNFLLQARILRKWFNKYSKIQKVDSEISQYNEKVLMNKYLVIIWSKKTNQNRENIQKAKVFFVRKYYNSWSSLITKNKDNLQKAKDYDTSRTIHRVLNIWMRKYRNILASKEDSLSLRESLLEKRDFKTKELIWKTWYDSMNKSSLTKSVYNLQMETLTETNLSQKIRQLHEYEVYFIKQKYFKVWRKFFALQNIYIQVRMNNKLLLKKSLFEDVWLRKARLYQLSTDFLTSKCLIEKRKIVNSWREVLQLKIISCDYNRKRLLSSALNLWKLKANLNSAREILSTNKNNIKRIILKHYFNNWIIQLRSSQIIKVSHHNLNMNYFKIWKKQYSVIKQQEHNADKISKYFIQRNVFNTWLEKSNRTNSLSMKSDSFTKQKFLKLILKKYNFYNTDMIIAADDYSKFGNLSSKILLKTTFSKWQDIFENRYHELSEFKIFQFHQNVINKNLLNTSLVKWVNLYNKRQTDLHELILREREFQMKSPLKHKFLNKWISSIRAKLELTKRAELFEITLLHKKFLIIWYNQFISKKVHLEEVYNNYLDQQEFRKVNEILKSWSMKYLKNFRRNEENCNDFIQRWNNTKVRAVFDLWLFKSREVTNKADDIPDERDLSIATNASPLTKKAYSQSVLRDNSYLYTPLKSQVRVNRTLDTPASPRVSPTKLQETTLRLKNERIDALRKHFGKAKRASSPTRNTFSATPMRSFNDTNVFNHTTTSKTKRVPLTTYAHISSDLKPVNSSFIRLSPPKMKNHISMSPPDPPNFDLRDTHSIMSDFSASTDIVKEHPEDEKSVIETAKKLRRITPIVFPTDDMETEPKFSPVNELKERLKNNYFSLSPNDEDVF